MIVKKEYSKPITEEQVLSVNTFVMAEQSNIGNGQHSTDPFDGAPKRRTNPF